MAQPIDVQRAIEAQTEWLAALGLENDAEVAGTPHRVVEFWMNKLVSGYAEEPREVLGMPLATESQGVVSLKNITFHSMCPHHRVPYFGMVDIAYKPSRHILGLGKFEHFVAACSRRLILQEARNEMLVNILTTHLDSQGVIVRINAQHLCFMLDGREPRETQITTWNSTGCLKDAFELFAGRGEAR